MRDFLVIAKVNLEKTGELVERLAFVWTSDREDVREVEDLTDEDLEDIFDMVEDERNVMTNYSVVCRVDIMVLRD